MQPLFFCGIGQVQHRPEGVEDQVPDAVCDEQTLLLGKQGDHHSVAQQLTFAVGQQTAAGSPGGLGAGLQLGGEQGIRLAGQVPAGCRELLQHLIDAAALGADGGQRDGIIPVGQPLVKGVGVHLFH